MNIKPSSLRLVVLYNVAEILPGRKAELVAEEAIEEAAGQTADALRQVGFQVQMLPVRHSLVDLVHKLQAARPDAVINICEGFAGLPALEAQVAGVLELMNLPFTGSSSATLALCQNKFKTKAILRAHGLPVPRGWLLRKNMEIPRNLRFPLIVKPSAEDASIGIDQNSVVHNLVTLKRQIALMEKRYGRPALVEEFIEGRELYLPLMQQNGNMRILAISEIPFHGLPAHLPHIVSFAAKWKPKSVWYRKTEPVCPTVLSRSLKDKLIRAAKKACAALDVRGYARLDFRVDRRENPFILEVNPNPDASLNAGWHHSLEAEGIDYRDFWRQQVQEILCPTQTKTKRSRESQS